MYWELQKRSMNSDDPCLNMTICFETYVIYLFYLCGNEFLLVNKNFNEWKENITMITRKG